MRHESVTDSVTRPLTGVAIGWTMLSALGCSTSPATGDVQVALLTQQEEIQIGREEHLKLVEAGVLLKDEALEAYVEKIGQRLAATGERPDLEWNFAILDDPAVNALALPGGYVYVTRGMLASLNSEAQLAGILGHEIGHVTGRHSVEQISRSQIAEALLAPWMILLPKLTMATTGQAVYLQMLKYGRDNESEADDLSVRYLTRAGYDPRPQVAVFVMLGRRQKMEAGPSIPEYRSTHPDPVYRAERMLRLIAASGSDYSDAVVGSARYLEQLEGLVYGPDPQLGFFQGNVFLHPGLEAQITFPEDWLADSKSDAVLSVSPSGEALVMAELTSQASAYEAAVAFFDRDTISGEPGAATSINGLSAVESEFSVSTGESSVVGHAIFVEHNASVFAVVGFASAGSWPRYEETILAAQRSFGPITDPAALEVEPMRVSIVTVGEAMTLEQLNERFPSSVTLWELAILNQMEPATRLAPGDMVKRVTVSPQP